MQLLLKYWWVFALGLIALAVYWMVQEYNDAQKDLGAADVVIEGQAGTITRTEEANEARNEITRPDSTVLYCQCLRSARGEPTACQRFLPTRYTSVSKPASLCD